MALWGGNWGSHLWSAVEAQSIPAEAAVRGPGSEREPQVYLTPCHLGASVHAVPPPDQQATPPHTPFPWLSPVQSSVLRLPFILRLSMDPSRVLARTARGPPRLALPS